MIVKKVKLGDLVSLGFKTKSKEYWDDLRSSLQDGYMPDSFVNGYIRITKFNNVIDGNHRLHIMKKLYGDEYEINVRVSGLSRSLMPRFIWWYNENIKQRFSLYPNTIDNDFYTVKTYDGKYELKVIKLSGLRELKNLRRLNYIIKKRPTTLFQKKSIMEGLSNSLLNDGYKPYEYGFIKIDRDGVIIDGYKRIHILLNRYGNNFELEVMSLKRLVGKRINIKTFLILFFIILTLLLIII